MTFQISALITILIFAVGVLSMFIVVNSPKNTLDWSHLISSGARDGKTYLDWNKIGQGCGVVVATIVPLIYVNSEKLGSGTDLLAVMVGSLTYLGMVTSYSTHLRAKSSSEVKNAQP